MERPIPWLRRRRSRRCRPRPSHRPRHRSRSRRTRRSRCGRSRPGSTSTSTSRSTTRPTPGRRSTASVGWPTTHEVEVAPGIHATFVDAGHILGSAIIRLRVVEREGGPERRTRVLRRPRPDGHADPARPHDRHRRRLRPRRVDLRQPRARAPGRIGPHPGRDRPARRRARRRAPRPVVRHRPDPGGRLGARPADLGRARSRSCRCTSTRRWPPRPPTSTATTPTTTTRRRATLLANDEIAARLSRPDRSPTTSRQSQAIAARAAAVHDRRLERDAHRRPGRRPPAQPHRRPERGPPVRRLPGRGHARRPSPGRREDGQDRRPAAPGPLPDPLDQRLLGPRRRSRELLDWLGELRAAASDPATPGFPRRVFLVHGDPDAQAALLPKVQALGFDAEIPVWHQEVELE